MTTIYSGVTNPEEARKAREAHVNKQYGAQGRHQDLQQDVTYGRARAQAGDQTIGRAGGGEVDRGTRDQLKQIGRWDSSSDATAGSTKAERSQGRSQDAQSASRKRQEQSGDSRAARRSAAASREAAQQRWAEGQDRRQGGGPQQRDSQESYDNKQRVQPRNKQAESSGRRGGKEFLNKKVEAMARSKAAVEEKKVISEKKAVEKEAYDLRQEQLTGSKTRAPTRDEVPDREKRLQLLLGADRSSSLTDTQDRLSRLGMLTDESQKQIDRRKENKEATRASSFVSDYAGRYLR